MILANLQPSTLKYINVPLAQIFEALFNITGQWNSEYPVVIDSPLSARCKLFVALVESKNNPASIGIEQDDSIAFGLYQFGYRGISFPQGTINPAFQVILEYQRRTNTNIKIQGTPQSWFQSEIQPIAGTSAMIAAQQAVADSLYFLPARDALSQTGKTNAVDMLFAYNLFINYGVVWGYDRLKEGTIPALERLLKTNPYEGVQAEFFQWRYSKILDLAKNDPNLSQVISLDWKGWNQVLTV